MKALRMPCAEISVKTVSRGNVKKQLRSDTFTSLLSCQACDDSVWLCERHAAPSLALLRTNSSNVFTLEQECSVLFSELTAVQNTLRVKLSNYVDGKNLKGNELVGWLGEIYGKLLLDGELVHDREEHDFICANGWKVSVKTRKGFGTGWRRTSAIPKLNGASCPTHLLFVHLNDDYSIDRMWLFPWQVLAAKERFKSHIVRGQHRSFIFTLDEKKDMAYLVFRGRTANHPKDVPVPRCEPTAGSV